MFDSLYQCFLEKQALPFVEYMQQALYAPVGGYYSSSRPKFGKEGDFITAPELSPLFGKTLAKQCLQIINARPDLNCILEFGAGSGRLCLDILQALEQAQSVPEHYFILELSAGLRGLQQETIATQLPHLLERVVWLNEWPEDFDGIVLANEVLDAMPVHRFLLSEAGLSEAWVLLDSQGRLQEEYRPIENDVLRTYIEQCLPSLPNPYQSEVNLIAAPWIKTLAQHLNQAVVFLLDYGFPRQEYYHEDRRLGTLMCHYKHHSHPDALQHPGEQDITAHVDFTLIAEAAVEAGFHVAGYTNQASFLLSNGLLSLLETAVSLREEVAQKQAVKQLTHPNEMGELFKVMALTKGVDMDLQGFLLSDKRASL